MKFVDEYRESRLAGRLVAEIRRSATTVWTIMEVCGGQTHAIIRGGIDQALHGVVELVHGPGCPVCVTPIEQIDRALAIAAQPRVIFCSFGDMLRVPGTESNLLRVRADGGDVRVVYSPLDAVELAERNPDRDVVFFAVGFETTAPATALAVLEANRRELKRFSLLVAHVRVVPAMRAVLSDPGRRVQGFLAAGHVCAVMGMEEYPALAEKYRVPIVATGFEPVDLLEGILMCVRQLEAGRAEVENQYARSVRSSGNLAARSYIEQVYVVRDRPWRGMGVLREGGLALAPAFAEFDAELRFPVQVVSRESEQCQSERVLAGRLRPDECPAFGVSCAPDTPLGAPMVSNEGACAAYYRFRRRAERAVELEALR